MEKDQGQSSNASGPKKSIKVSVVNNGLLIGLRGKMSREVCLAFEKKYGRILDTLIISPDRSMLSALAQFWNRDLRCFEFPSLNMVPTIEEYETILRLPIKAEASVYIYKGGYVSRRKIAELIGLSANYAELEVRGSIQGWKRSYLEDHLKTLAEEGNWEHLPY